MTCPACDGRIVTADLERGVHVSCGNPFCESAEMQEGEWGHDETEAYDNLVAQFELKEGL